jgi:hypothetical protein
VNDVPRQTVTPYRTQVRCSVQPLSQATWKQIKLLFLTVGGNSLYVRYISVKMDAVLLKGL